MPRLPILDIWAHVAPSKAAGDLEMLKVTKSPGGGYLLITVERGAQYDTWYESLDEIRADLEGLDLDWQGSDGESVKRQSKVSENPNGD